MKYRWIGRVAMGVALALAMLAALGWVVMSLWNWLLPGLLGWPRLSVLQAIALLVLTRLLFGSLRPRWGHGGFGHRAWRERARGQWATMSEAEREKLRAGLRARCMPRHSRPEE